MTDRKMNGVRSKLNRSSTGSSSDREGLSGRVLLRDDLRKRSGLVGVNLESVDNKIGDISSSAAVKLHPSERQSSYFRRGKRDSNEVQRTFQFQRAYSSSYEKLSTLDTMARDERADSDLSLVTKRGQLNKKSYADSVHRDDPTSSFLCNKEGYLRKESRKGRYQRRYFVTNLHYVNYYKHKGTYINGDKALASASIDLRAAATICILTKNGKPTRKFAIQTRQSGSLQEECFFLKAKSVEEATEWVQVLLARKNYFSADEDTKTKIQKSVKDISDDSQEAKRPSSASNATEDAHWWQESSEKNASSDSSSDEIDSDDEGFITGLDSDDENSDEAMSAASEVSFQSSDYFCDTKLLSQLRNSPKNLDGKSWSEPDYRKLMIRGATYLDDKQKIQASEPLFKLVCVDLFRTKGRLDHIASHPSNRVKKALDRGDKLPFLYIVHIQIPGPPFYSYVMYFASKRQCCSVLHGENISGFPSGFADLARKFFLGDDDSLRDNRFKLCPRVVEGPFVVRHGVPNKPALIGKKLKHRYFRSPEYLEMCIDIGSSTVAWKLTQMAVGYAKLITIDLAFVLQGNSAEELPEQVLGITRANQLDMNDAVELEE